MKETRIREEDIRHWTDTRVEVGSDWETKVIKYAEVDVGRRKYVTTLDPATCLIILVRGKVPVKQGLKAKRKRPVILTPIIVDIERLKAGNYEWEIVSFEDIEAGYRPFSK